MTEDTADRPGINFESISFSDGTVVSLDKSDIVVFVGPNNAGKSAALRELYNAPSIKPGLVITSTSLRKSGTFDQFIALVECTAQESGGDSPSFRGFGIAASREALRLIWDLQIEPIWQFFCMRMETENRIRGSNPERSIHILDDPPTHPIHMLARDEHIEQKISSYFRKAFGKDLIVFHDGGQTWPLLVGDQPALQAGDHRYSPEYLKKLRSQTVPLLDQGDGMRSFASVILHMLAPNSPSILILDEPEAFLHPPQAKLLGEFLANERPPQAQLFMATHSPDVLQGLLNVAPNHLRVLRIQRDGPINRVKELDKTRAKAISSDSLMKYSSVLSGVFHERVIICESDADCMFYGTILDLAAVHGTRQPDVLFLQAAGKHRMASLAEALRALDVDVDVIADMDVLDDENVFKRLVQALGGEWSAIQAKARSVKIQIEQHKPWLNALKTKNEIQKILDTTPSEGLFPRDRRAQIESLFKKASPWDAVKQSGESAIPRGQAMAHYKELKKHCEKFGLWIVPVGELEGFCNSDGNHGPRWVQSVIETHDLASDAELEPARRFVGAVWMREIKCDATCAPT